MQIAISEKRNTKAGVRMNDESAVSGSRGGALGPRGPAPLTRRLVVLALLASLFLLFGTSLASARKLHPLIDRVLISGKEPQGYGIAVDEASHHAYAVNTSSGQVFNLESTGKSDPVHPELTGSPPGFQAFGVAVDNSGGIHQGYVYATSRITGEVQQFNPAAKATSVRIRATSIPIDGTLQGGGLQNVINNGQFEPRGVAVNSSGDVLVFDSANNAFDQFSPEGAFLAQLAAGEFSSADFIVFDSANHIFLSSGSIVELEPDGSCVNLCAPISPGFPVGGVAIGADGNILAAGEVPPRLVEFTPAGNLVSESSGSGIMQPVSVAVDKSLGRIFVADVAKPEGIFAGGVNIFGPLLTLPNATTLAATEVTDSSASFHGIVNADQGPEATCAFQYIDEPSFESHGFEGAATAQCSPAGPFSGEDDEAVSATVSDLNGGTKYHYRLLASNESGSNPGADLPFLTLGPKVIGEQVTEITEVGALLEGRINPEGKDTTYVFQYVRQAQFEASGWADAVEAPPSGGIGAGSEFVNVSQRIEGLSPGGKYRFRIVASSPDGESVGANASFATYATSVPSPPDGRAYEQVTPIAKNGGDAGGWKYLLKAAPGGDAATYFITGGGSAGGGGQDFPTYAASRSGGDWSSHPFLPNSGFGERGTVIGWSEDLKRDYVLVWNSGTLATLYEQVLATGLLKEIASGLAPETGAFYAGESADGGQVLFESTSALTPEAKEGVSNLYVWDSTTQALSLVSALPDESTPSGGAFAGPYAWSVLNFSEGGAGASVYTQDLHVISSDGTKVFFTTSGGNQLYVRRGVGTASPSTAQVSASQKSNGSGPGGKDPKGPKKAAFMEATPDGRYVFFTSPEDLTNDATTGTSGNDLYRYDVESEQLIDLAPDPVDNNGAQVQGLLGSSSDGSYVYFAANGVLAAGAALGNCHSSPIAGWSSGGSCNLYLWHDGTITFVSRLGGFSDDSSVGWLSASVTGGNVRSMKSSRVSQDGKTVSFVTSLSPTAYDSEGNNEFYRYNTEEGLECVSCNPIGAKPTSNATLQDIEPGFTKPNTPNAFLVSHLSADGSRVFFETPDKLVANDTNGDANCIGTGGGAFSCQDVYEWEANGTGSCDSDTQNGGCLYLVSTGESAEASYFADASANGDNVFFFTRQSLVRQDIDQLYDVYDARVGGGIPSQDAPPPTPCEGEACKPGAAAPPSPASPGSASLVGPGDPKPNHHKKKRHGKKHHKKSKKAKGRAGR